jgi:predicted lactoylglutathione lyase
MIGYVTLGTNDLARAGQFYDALLGTLGATRTMATDRFIAWAVGDGTSALCVIKPFDRKPATVGNGVMVALAMSSRAQVDGFHQKAIELGGTDEGAPGERLGGAIYAGYFRDPDGNKLNAYVMGS